MVTDGGAVLILDVDTGKDRFPLPALTERVWNVAFSPDRKQIAATTGSTLSSGPTSGRFYAGSPMSGTMASRPFSTLSLRATWSRFAQGCQRSAPRTRTNREIRLLEGDLKPFAASYGALYRNGAVTPNGSLAALEGLDNGVRVFDLGTESFCRSTRWRPSTRYRFSRDGAFLAIERDG